MDVVSLKKATEAWKFSLARTSVNPHFRKWTPTYMDTFGDTTSRWVNTTGGTVEDDDVHYTIAGADKRENGAYVRTNGYSMRLTKTTTTNRNARCEVNLSSPIDLTDQHAILRFYIHEGAENTSWEYLYAVFLFLIDANGKYAYWDDTGGGGLNWRPGWRTMPLVKGGYAGQSEGFDITQVSKIRVQFSTKTGHEDKTPSVTFDWLEFFPILKPPIPYVVTLDGSYKSHKPALAYMATRGIRGHIYAWYDRVGASEYLMTLDDLKWAESIGHIVDVHERYAQPTGWFTLTQAQKEQSVLESMAWKVKHGFVQGKGFATMRTEWLYDYDTFNTLMPYLEHVRVGGSRRRLVPWNPRLVGVSYDTATLTVENEALMRQAAVEDGLFYVGLVHDLKGNFTLEDFKTIIDAACDDPNIQFCTVHELINTDWYGRDVQH